jgi:uncharacterized protein (DUF302 family)
MADVSSGDAPFPTASEALHTTLDVPFEDAILRVQLEHELAGFETVKVTRLDRLVEGVLGEEIQRVALVVVCHAEIARDAVEIDPMLAGLLPCTTIVYEIPGDDAAHVYHVSATKAIRDLGFAQDAGEAVADLVDLTGDRMAEVWENIEAIEGVEPLE